MSMEPLQLTLSDFAGLSIFKSMKIPKIIGSISEIDLFSFRMGLLNCAFSGREGIPENISELPPSYYDTSISSYVKDNDKIMGMFLIRKNEDDSLEMILLQALGVDAKTYLVGMMRNAYARALETYEGDTPVIIPRVSKESIALTKHLFPGR